MNEVWLDIPGYKGRYEVSNMGRVKSFARNKRGRILRPCKNGWGHLQVRLFKNAKGSHLFVHRLVMLAFVGKPKKHIQVNHLNGIKKDNRLSNLEYCTASENSIHAAKNGLYKPCRGSKNGNSKLTEKQARDIFNSKSRRSCLAAKYGVSETLVYAIKARKRWAHIHG